MMRIGKRCYVSNLAWRTSWQDLKDKFRECGTVVYANVTRGEDGECDVAHRAALIARSRCSFLTSCAVVS